MKTTLDLPPDLVKRMKIRAVQEGRPLKRLVTDLLLSGMNASSGAVVAEQSPLPAALTLNERGFPVVRSGTNAPASAMTLAELLALEQQTQLEEDLQRAGITH